MVSFDSGACIVRDNEKLDQAFICLAIAYTPNCIKGLCLSQVIDQYSLLVIVGWIFVCLVTTQVMRP